MVLAPDVEPRVRRNVRVDPCLGVASVKDVIFVVTGRSGSAATQLIRELAKKHPWVTDNFSSVALQGKGNRTPVADFPALVDVIFVVEDCTRDAARPVDKKFDIAEALGVVMQADLAPVHRRAADMTVKYQDANDEVPKWLSYYTAAGMQQRDA